MVECKIKFYQEKKNLYIFSDVTVSFRIHLSTAFFFLPYSFYTRDKLTGYFKNFNTF